MPAIAKVAKLPLCDFPHATDIPALYDFATNSGPWAFGCETHYQENRRHSTLGTGKAQRLEVAK